MSIMAKSGKPPQAGHDAAQAKRKQFSRNKKKNWRKFLNTKEVKDLLLSLRQLHFAS
jgi:hypothetical protein